MRSFQIECGNLVIEIHCVYEYTLNRCAKFICAEKAADIVIEPSFSEYKSFKPAFEKMSEEYTEYMLIFSLLCEKVLDCGGVFIHSSVISVDNKGYAFLARSGVGKTTQTLLWKDYFKDRARIINGDKPLLTISDSMVYASGTPWCGKESFSENETVPLNALYFIERSDENFAECITSHEALEKLLKQFLIPHSGNENIQNALKVADAIIKSVPIFRLHCNTDISAVKVAYDIANYGGIE